MSLSVRYVLDVRSPSLEYRSPPYGRGLSLDEGTPLGDGTQLRRLLGDSAINPFGMQSADADRVLSRSRSPDIKSSRKLSQSARVVPTNFAKVNVLIVAPGAGIGHNGEAYWQLKEDTMFSVKVFGRSGMKYDHYPIEWPEGRQEPNLASFSKDLAVGGDLANFDCLIFGSRGGQVVLPCLWQMGLDLPPAIVLNGGCALDMPRPPAWPANAVTLLVLGGKDYFRKKHIKPSQYVHDAMRRVPPTNKTTALLYVHEMAHLPSSQLLTVLLRDGICGLIAWKSTGKFPFTTFQGILAAIKSLGLSACLSYTAGDGVWCELADSSPVSSPTKSPTTLEVPSRFGISEAEGRQPLQPTQQQQAKAREREQSPPASPRKALSAELQASSQQLSSQGYTGRSQVSRQAYPASSRRSARLSPPTPTPQCQLYGCGSLALPGDVMTPVPATPLSFTPVARSPVARTPVAPTPSRPTSTLSRTGGGSMQLVPSSRPRSVVPSVVPGVATPQGTPLVTQFREALQPKPAYQALSPSLRYSVTMPLTPWVATR
mmetsp:Transcript_41420/g.96263  ORF Transcript_41420/g.96263 Transcript_41420/m.96263 type:complete len:543 (+) Transcript_41420:62-1690(+)